jgi:hypothetical protein
MTTRKLDEYHEQEIAERWKECVRRALGCEFEPTLSHGCKLSNDFSEDYLTKLGLEIASIDTKTGNKGNRNPWQIAQDAVSGCEKSKRLWQDYCQDMAKARQLTWSRGCRRAFGLGVELSDDELASDGVPVVDEGVGFVLGEFSGTTWDRMAWRRGFVASVIAAATSELPITSLEKLSCKNISPPGRVFSDATREPSLSRRTWNSSSPPHSNVTEEYGARESPPDQVPSSAIVAAIR